MEALDPADAEDISKRIAYAHLSEGCDKTGWDLTQLLRIPDTYNLKYSDVSVQTPIIKVIETTTRRFRAADFVAYPPTFDTVYLEIPFPETLPETDADDLLSSYNRKLNPLVWGLFHTTPEEHMWSEALFKLCMILFETGLSREEVFVIAKASKCNKWERDGHDDLALWKDICRAFGKNEYNMNVIIPFDYVNEPLISIEEKAAVEANPSFVERYIEWAKSLGDAASQYHQAGAFIALSSLLAGSVRLPTSFGTIAPNLWFMILADTTLTRKSTAMDIATDLIQEIDSDIVLATDGSIEGLLTSLSTRPGRPSMFLRDEFSGLLEMMTKKDYYAGMAEMFTKLYDGKLQKRILRKEVIEVKDPILILFAGGIKNRITGLLSLDHVSSGFMPRFIFITAESDVSKVQALGPPTAANLGDRELILNELRDIAMHYQTTQGMVVKDGKIGMSTPTTWAANLDHETWERYNKLEAELTKAGVAAEQPDIMTPVFDRLAKSILKAAILLAAARQRNATVVVEMEDLLRAIYYGESWREYAQQVINNVGKGTIERELEKIEAAIARKPGCTRSTLMQSYHLEARHAEQIFTTLEQRGVINRVRQGRTEQLFPVSHTKKVPTS